MLDPLDRGRDLLPARACSVGGALSELLPLGTVHPCALMKTWVSPYAINSENCETDPIYSCISFVGF